MIYFDSWLFYVFLLIFFCNLFLVIILGLPLSFVSFTQGFLFIIFAAINEHFNSLEANSWDNVGLLCQLFLKKSRKVIILLIFLESLVCFHNAMASIVHMLSDCLSALEILGLFILASNAHMSNLNLLL